VRPAIRRAASPSARGLIPSPAFSCGGRLGRGRKVLQYHLDNPIHVRQYITVPKPQDTEALRREKGCTPIVIFPRVDVLTSVYLDDEFVFDTTEVNDEVTNRMLASKSRADQ